MIRRRHKAGASLVELMIASVLIGIVLTATSRLIVACLQHSRDTESSVMAHNTALSSITLLERELKETNAASFAIFASPPGVVFASPRLPDNTIDYDDTNLQPFWQKWICYYLEPAGSEFNLVRKEEYFPVANITDTPPTPTAAENTAYFQGSVNTGGVIARGLTKLEWTPGPPLEIVLACTDISHRGTSTESEFLVEVSTSVSFRN